MPRLDLTLTVQGASLILFSLRCHSAALVWRAERDQQRSQLRAALQPHHMMPWICVYDDSGNVIETHKHTGQFHEAE